MTVLFRYPGETPWRPKRKPLGSAGVNVSLAYSTWQKLAAMATDEERAAALAQSEEWYGGWEEHKPGVVERMVTPLLWKPVLRRLLTTGGPVKPSVELHELEQMARGGRGRGAVMGARISREAYNQHVLWRGGLTSSEYVAHLVWAAWKEDRGQADVRD